ncbi:histidine kinase, partial [bacterium]|nr:histidine kinase [bacterium]
FADPPTTTDGLTQELPLSVAAEDDTLKYVASTYSHENHTIYDGSSRQGHRVITFAPILKQKLFPLPDILELLLEMGSWAMGTPVEIEFAGNISVPKDRPQEFGFLQMRPLVLRHEFDALTIEEISQEKLICRSDKVMGNGVIKDIQDIVYVDVDQFDRFKSRDVATEVSTFNAKLLTENRPYLLIGVGRWGSLDPLLGIPVKWDQISGAKVIVETGFKELDVTPSQGSHFFHNLTSFMVGYFTVTSSSSDAFINWSWLSQQETLELKKFCRLIRLEQPITVKMNGRKNEGVIIQPGVSR